MEATLWNLFDYQKFEEDARLQHVINAVHTKYGMRELSLNELEMVNAAGSPELRARQKDGKTGNGAEY